MKTLTLILTACLAVCAGLAKAQKRGDTININGVRAQILTIDEEGDGIAVHYISGVFCKSPEIVGNFPQNSFSNGKQNTQALIKYIAENEYGLANFPALKEIKTLGEDWYIPSYNELRDGIIESVEVDWDVEDDLDYTQTGGFLIFPTPLAVVNNKIPTSTISDGKLIGCWYMNPVSVYNTTDVAKQGCFAFCKFNINNVAMISEPNQRASTVTSTAQATTRPTSQTVSATAAEDNGSKTAKAIHDGNSTANPDKADFRLESTVPAEFKLEDNIVVKNSTSYTLTKVTVLHNGDVVCIGYSIDAGNDEEIKKYNNNGLLKYCGERLTVLVDCPAAKNSQAQMNIKFSAKHNDLIIEIYSGEKKEKEKGKTMQFLKKGVGSIIDKATN